MNDSDWNEPNLSPTDAVRQHYVPRMLLRNFAIDGIVPVYETATGREFPSTPENIGVESGFYDVQADGDVLSAEGWLAELEGQAADVLRRIIGKPAQLRTLSESDESTLSRFVAALDMRGPGMRAQDEQMRQQLLDQLKKTGRHWLSTQFKEEVADEIWRAWEENPDEWFLHEEEPYQPAKTTAYLLGEVQGFANILRAMPWRTGCTEANSRVYLSDNPVARYRFATGDFANYAQHVYYLPLTPRVVLKIGPYIAQAQPARTVEDFSLWETSLVRHVVTASASRHLYGAGPYVPSKCAATCLSRVYRLRASGPFTGLPPTP